MIVAVRLEVGREVSYALLFKSQRHVVREIQQYQPCGADADSALKSTRMLDRLLSACGL
jgi:hypothetical protein